MLLKYALDRNLQTPSHHQAMVRACFVAGRLTGANPGGPRWALAMGTGSLQGTPERRPWKGEPEGPGPRRGPGV